MAIAELNFAVTTGTGNVGFHLFINSIRVYFGLLLKQREEKRGVISVNWNP